MNYVPSGCGLFAMLRKDHAHKIPGKYIVSGITEVKHRGSDRGAGYAMFNLNDNNYYIRAFSNKDIKKDLERLGINVIKSYKINLNGIKDRCYDVSINNNMMSLEMINNELWNDKSRIYSYGRLNVMKGVGYPEDIARLYKIEELSADMWLAHTRQPTNSPGNLPFWSHPFSSFNVAIVHNGDISSFGSNARYVESLGIKSLVGTDSEVVSYLFNDLVNKNGVLNAVRILSGASMDLKRSYKNAMLDGPYSMAIGYDSGDDLYLIAMVDKHKFRPLYIGEDDDYYYAASEISQITEISKNALIWPLPAGSYFIASMHRGIISGIKGNINVSFNGEYDIDASGIPYNEINNEIKRLNKNSVSIINVHGHKYIGMGLRNLNIKIYGNPGNCLANVNDNNNIEVFGNVLDDCGDAMSSGNIFIHGSAGDSLGQAMSGGSIYVKNSTQARTGIQMRSYLNVPYIVIGDTFGDYLGEYMAGGRIIVLGNKHTGRFIGTGMLSGKIYINGRINHENIGIKNDDKRLLMALKTLKKFDKNIKINDYIKNDDNLNIEYRKLNNEELKEVSMHVKVYDEHFKTSYINKIKNRFTIISGKH
ncbi:class II glutamine amidotransferase [Picrophilus oshimae]|uniref:Glutamate synthase [NADPH] large chain II n=1 Tax=Picrophilus torridus (strain ATCC 700027 / DSM 9790 / JCM 10055 / NBRC 100828 / KAW 2/3) TaxID=1122961 RepID=Q6KZ05_PICTO|nr:glutamate synthase [Picrophilus oshimae]AAT44047.1 glutamate synthase [NADPH] large chain fragment II [Picrophilus oshimae DSM 9789]